MATENFVLITGILLNPVTFTEENGFKQADFSVISLRKERHTPAGMDESDEIHCSTHDDSVILALKKIKPGTILSIIGTYCSLDIEKYFSCENPECKYYDVPQSYKGLRTYISPIEVMPMDYKGEDAIAPQMRLHRYREHSNNVRLIGRALAEPKHITVPVVNKKTKAQELIHIWKLKLAIKRQKYITSSLATCDYVTVDSYENPTEVDEHDFVMVNGFVKSKTHVKKRSCQCCGKPILTKDYSLTVVPYTLEHIKVNAKQERNQ